MIAIFLKWLRGLFKPRISRHAAAVALGRAGGRKGGLAVAAKMTARERSERARKAARTRWDRARAGFRAGLEDEK